MATLDDTNCGAGAFGSTGIKPIVQSPQQKDKKGQKKKNSLSPTPGSQSQQAQNSVNMVVSAGPGPSSMSWMARESTFEGTVAVGGRLKRPGSPQQGWIPQVKLKGGRHSSLQQGLAGDLYAYWWIQGRPVTILMLENVQREE